jgi:hypothetical protein
MDLEQYRLALDSEEAKPEESLETYKWLERRNKTINKSILLLGVLSPIVAIFIIYYFVTLETHKILVAILIWVGVGFAPTYWYSVIREMQARGTRTLERDGEDTFLAIYLLAILPFIAAFANILVLIITGIIAAIFSVIILSIVEFISYILLGAPFSWGMGVPWYIREPIIVISFISVFIFGATDIPINRIFSIKWILIGLKIRAKRILLFFSGLILTAILAYVWYSGPVDPFNLVVENLTQSLIVSVWAGLMFGSALAQTEKNPSFGNLLRISKIRCLILTGHNIEAYYLLDSMVKEDLSGEPHGTIYYLSSVMQSILINIPPGRVIAEIALAEEAVGNDKYKEIISINIQKTKDLLYGRKMEFPSKDPIFVPINHTIKKGLIKSLLDEDIEVREYVIQALKKIDNVKLEPLTQALRGKDFNFIFELDEALENYGGAEALVEPLILLLSDEDSIIRGGAATVLGKIGDPKTVAPLIFALEDDTPGVLIDVAKALGEINDKEAVDPLVRLLNYRGLFEVNVRLNGMKALGKLGDARALEPLMKIAKDESEEDKVRKEARDTINQIIR